MADFDELPRSLALAKAGLVSPEGARARVRARLAQNAGGASAGSDGGRVLSRALGGLTRARAWTAGLMALSFVAGYWLRGERLGPARVEPVTAQLQAVGAERVQAEAPVGAPLVMGEAPGEAEAVAQRGELAVSRTAGGVSRRKSAADARPAPRATRASESQRPEAPPAADGLAQEVALLQRVERAIRAQEGELALALLSEHERDYPASSFREERAAARVLAACVAQPGSAGGERARADARHYLAGRTHSVYADRIRTLCQIDP